MVDISHVSWPWISCSPIVFQKGPGHLIFWMRIHWIWTKQCMSERPWKHRPCNQKACSTQNNNMNWSQLEMTSGPKDFKFWSSKYRSEQTQFIQIHMVFLGTMCRSITRSPQWSSLPKHEKFPHFPPEIDGHDKRAELNFLSFEA